MIHSRDRILTTHVGSLPRNDVLTDLLIRREAGETIDRARWRARWTAPCATMVDAQTAAGIDIGNDGEQQRVGFQTYIPARMSGFGGESKRKVGKDFQEVPELIEHVPAALSQAQQDLERAAGASARCAISTPRTSRTRSRASRPARRERGRRSPRRS